MEKSTHASEKQLSVFISFFFPEPVDESLLSAVRKSITVKKINNYNNLAEKAL